MSRIRRIRDHYRPRIGTERPHFDILDWADAQSQQIRFKVLVDNVKLDSCTLLDVGCGLGDLLTYLTQRKLSVTYTGVDIVNEMVQRAQQLHPDARFVCTDIFDKTQCTLDAGEQFDVVFCSGMLNLDLGNAREFLVTAIERMLELSRKCLVFNLLHIRSEHHYEHCVYHDPQMVKELLSEYGCDVRIVDDYLPNDFTVVCTREDS